MQYEPFIHYTVFLQGKKHLFDYTKTLRGFVFFCRETKDAILNKKRITEEQEKEIYVVQYFTDKKRTRHKSGKISYLIESSYTL